MIELGREAILISTSSWFQLYIKDTTLSKSKQDWTTYFNHGLPIIHIRVLNALVPKSLEPNIIVYVCETSWRFESQTLPPTPYKHLYLKTLHVVLDRDG